MQGQIRRRLLLGAVLSAATASGCIGLLSHSYAYVTLDRRPMVSESDWTPGVLHLTEPLIENVVVDLTHRLEAGCAGHGLVNVQTKVTVREFLLFQIYSVRLSAGCAPDGPSAGVQPTGLHSTTSRRPGEWMAQAPLSRA